MYYIFSIHSSVDGHLGCFRVFATVKSAAVNTGVHVKKNEMMTFAATWMNPEMIVLSEVSQTKANTV